MLHSAVSVFCVLQVNLGNTSDAVESVANVTDIHEAMFFHADDEAVTRSNFGIWSLRWSPDGKEIIAGTGDSSLYIYDVEQQKVALCLLCLTCKPRPGYNALKHISGFLHCQHMHHSIVIAWHNLYLHQGLVLSHNAVVTMPPQTLPFICHE